MWKLNGHLSIVKLLVRKFKILNLATLEASAAHWRLLLRLSQVRYYLINMIAGSEIRFRIKKFFFSLVIRCVGVSRHPHEPPLLYILPLWKLNAFFLFVDNSTLQLEADFLLRVIPLKCLFLLNIFFSGNKCLEI